jgi:hypothetical protein
LWVKVGTKYGLGRKRTSKTRLNSTGWPCFQPNDTIVTASLPVPP